MVRRYRCTIHAYACSPQFETYVLTAEALPRSGATPYVRAGNLPVILLVPGVLIYGVLTARRQPV